MSQLEWTNFFDSLTQYFSEGEFAPEVLKARETFFEKLGRSHEMREDLYEAVSRSFLEWYLFDYKLESRGKPPAVVFVALGWGEPEERELLCRLLFHHWSIFKVENNEAQEIELKDLIFNKTRYLQIDRNDPQFAVWRVEKQQIIQARLFPTTQDQRFFATHVWLHPESENKLLIELAEKRSQIWGDHRDFLFKSLESLVRSMSLYDQIMASGSRNWIYQELRKVYA